MNSFYLSVTSLFFLLPIIIFLRNNKKTIFENILASMLLTNVILSFLFWTNPIENSLVHFYDGILAKISYIVFPIYILFVKNVGNTIKLIFLMVYFLSALMFYYSNNNSKKNWCSKQHVICHSIFHFLVSVGCCIAFI